jgi:hypothetical protein
MTPRVGSAMSSLVVRLEASYMHYAGRGYCRGFHYSIVLLDCNCNLLLRRTVKISSVLTELYYVRQMCHWRSTSKANQCNPDHSLLLWLCQVVFNETRELSRTLIVSQLKCVSIYV